MSLELLARCVADAIDVELVLARELAHEMLRQHGDVLDPFAQGREQHLEHVETIVQIFTQASVANCLRWRTIRRGENADVELDVLRSAEPTRLTFLEHAQQLGLERDRHLGDLVEKERASVGHLEHARPRTRRAGERACS
jgi:hypothetical protein